MPQNAMKGRDTCAVSTSHKNGIWVRFWRKWRGPCMSYAAVSILDNCQTNNSSCLKNSENVSHATRQKREEFYMPSILFLDVFTFQGSLVVGLPISSSSLPRIQPFFFGSVCHSLTAIWYIFGIPHFSLLHKVTDTSAYVIPLTCLPQCPMSLHFSPLSDLQRFSNIKTLLH